MSQDYATILGSVLSAAASRINAAERPVGRTELIPGLLPAWDDCCKGQLYLRVMEIYPTMGPDNKSPFPQIDASQVGVNPQCSIQMFAVHIGLGILRCVATQDNTGKPPSPEKVTSDGESGLLDMQLLLDAIVCDVPGLPGILKMKLDRWTPLGAEGSCAGGEWSAYLAIDPCLSCTTDS